MASHIETNPYKKVVTLLIYCAVIISGLCIDIYTPSLPAISDFFNVAQTTAKYTITIYMLGLGIGQPLVAPFSDHFGRRWILTIGLFVSAITFILAAHASNIGTLMVIRFAQGLAASCVSVPARAIVSDLFEGLAFKKVVSTMTVVWALGPLLAPYIGGYIQHYFGWQGCFYALTIYFGAIGVAMLCVLRESLKQPAALHLGHVLKTYVEIACHRQYILGVCLQGLAYSQIVIFGVLGSFLVQKALHFSAIAFGRCALVVGAGWLVGNIVNRLLIDTNETKKLNNAIYSGFTIAVVMLLFAITGLFNIYTLVLPVVLLAFCGSIVFPIAFANTLALFPKHAAKANALMIGVVMIAAGLVTTLCSSFHDLNLYPISISYVIIWGLSIIIKRAFCR